MGFFVQDQVGMGNFRFGLLKFAAMLRDSPETGTVTVRNDGQITQIRMKYLILYMGSLALGSAGAWIISRWGTTLGVLDRANHRSSHDGVVAKGGGIGILAAFILSA